MVYLIVITCVALELIAQVICLNKFYEKKHNSKLLFWGSSIGVHILCIGNYFLTYYNVQSTFLKLILNLVIYFIIFFLLFIINYKAPKWHYPICSMFAVCAMSITETFSLTIVDTIWTSTAPGKFMDAYNLVFSFVSKFTYLIVLYGIVWLINKIKINYNLKKISSIMILPIFTVLSETVLVCVYFDELSQTRYIQLLLIVVLFLILTIAEFVFIYFRSQKQQEELSLLQTEKLQYQLDNTYLKLLENQNEEMHILAHDIKNHLSTIGAMSDIEDVKNYVQTVYADYSNINLAKTSNKMIDIILYKYAMVCKSHNIDFVLETKTANLSYIEESQLSSLLNNLLDNAVESAKNSKNKVVEMTIRKEHNFDVLTVANSCDTEPDLTKTSKLDNKNHGYGTKIIKRIVAKNNGEIEYRYDSKNQNFIITIIFPAE